MRFETNYPRRNSNPSHIVSIAGTIPPNLRINFLAFYAASQTFEFCSRSMPLTPGFRLHLVEPLDDVRTGSTYKVTVTADKYLPGDCGWALDAVGYQLLDEDRDIVKEGLEKGGVVIVYFSRPDSFPPAGDSPTSWRGRVDLWCYKGPMGRLQMPEGCAALGGFPRNFQAMVAPDQRDSEASTWVSQDARSAEVNFHDLNVLVTQHADGK